MIQVLPHFAYSLFNPSIGDYIIGSYGENAHLLAEDLISVEECIDGCDFSDYVHSNDDDGTDWEDFRDCRELERRFEDEQIRAIFRRA